MAKKYKETLNLPRTDFPMRGNLGKREPDQVQRWLDQDIYQKMLEKNRDAQPFLFHDGPPYANGRIHHGHILNKVLKDFVVKYRNMAGQRCSFVPGWDCHGLPIEHQVDQELGDKRFEMSQGDIRRACRAYADKYVDLQREDFKRVMVFANWDEPYLTMNYGYEAQTIRELGKVFGRRLAYRGLKPVHWDWDARTALAEAEVEYDSFRTEHVYALFPFEELPEHLAEAAGSRETFVAIWTTTPWTLPSNLAIALHPELNYQLVAHEGKAFVLAEGLREEVVSACKLEGLEILASFEGRELVGELGEGKGLKAKHPFIDRDSVLLPADYVTLEQGTGCVHTAPGHGQEDFFLGQQFGLDVLVPVDDDGKFTSKFAELEGEHVFRANPKIVTKLHEAGRLLNQPGEKITIDRYPHGWRSKKPVIFRATTQWFVAMEPESAHDPRAEYPLRQRALEVIEDVDWVPGWGHDRIQGMIEGRPDWCISRQRSWGVPITVVHCEDCDHTLAEESIANHVADLVEEGGADVWFDRSVEELLPEGTSCPECGGSDFAKEGDILDVWFDSGVSWSAVLDKMLGQGRVADLYLEGSDQHRGWFQSSLMCGLLSGDQSPYKTCLTHGFIVDEDGHKYSKSSKNFEPPQKMLDRWGAEILRLWVSAVDYRGDITLSEEILKRIADSYRKVRNTFRFLLGNLKGFDPTQDLVPMEELEELDRWVLHRVGEAIVRMEEAYETYQFHQIYHRLVQLMTVDLSNVFMDVTKDRMYCETPDDPRRRSGQTAYWLALQALARAVAPVLSFTAEEVWQHRPGASEEDEASVFLQDFPAEARDWIDEELGQRWEELLEVRTQVQRALEARRADGELGSSQQAVVTLKASGNRHALLASYSEHLAALCIVSELELQEGDWSVEVALSDKEKCPRCWNYWRQEEQEICPRCQEVVEAL